MSKLIPTCANILAPFVSFFRSQPNVELNSGAVNLRLREKEGVTSLAAAENNLEVITITSLLAAHGPTKLIGLNFEKSVPLKGKCKICQRIVFRRHGDT